MMKFYKVKDFFLNNKLKTGLIATVLLTTIGYAAVNTSLNIAGNIELKRDSSLKVFFKSVSLDGINIDSKISSDRESFTIKQSDIKEIGISTINYEIHNGMKDYDAKVSVSCTPEYHNNTSLNYNGDEELIKSGASVNGNVLANTTENSKITIYDEVKNQTRGADSQINYKEISSNTNGKGVYTTINTDSGSEVYFYRGEVTNNNVIFGGFCWLIVRTTETGGVKLLYNGTPTGGQCAKPSGNGITTSAYNASRNDNAYVGYMYGSTGTTYANTHVNTHDSTIKTVIDNWYKSNIEGKDIEQYLEDTVWCNDRSLSSGTGAGTTNTTYAFSARMDSYTPTLKCARDLDKLTVASGYLKYPIATLTADEIMYAGSGGTVGSDGTTQDNTTMYLNNSNSFWTMTPMGAYTRSATSYAQGTSYFSESAQTGALSRIWTGVYRTFGVRPSISLKAGTEINSGDGSNNNPYIIGPQDNKNTVDINYTCKLNITLLKEETSIIGKEYCFESECFNVVGYDGENFKLLAKYNLLVGYNTSTSSTNYGHQDPSALGDKADPPIGTVEFGSNNNYSTSSAKTYVDNYVTWLNSTYDLGATGRLITNDELVEIGCRTDVGNYGCSTDYIGNNTWIINTTYYTGTPGTESNRINLVGGDGYFGTSNVTSTTNRGVRPLIIVPKDKVNINLPQTEIPASWQDNGVFSEYYNQAYKKLQAMTLPEKVGQLLIMTYSSSDSLSAVQNYNLSGVVFYEADFTGKTIAQVQSMTGELQSKVKTPLLLAVDEEGGRVTRIATNKNLVSEELSKYPDLFYTRNTDSKNAWKLASTLYTESGNNFDLITKEENVRNTVIKKLGLNINFAPVVDIASPPAYISDRSFGTDPALVSEYTKAVINAGKGSGVSHALKHFPGYGNNQDTHTSSSVDETSMEELNNIHLKPFIAGIEAGAQAVMISHNTVSALDKDYPASLSSPVHELLFNDLGFTGVAITDDLSMDAIGNKYSNQYLKAFKAGNHILLTSAQYATAYNEILSAVQSGEVSMEELEKRVFKVLAWKYYNGIITD